MSNDLFAGIGAMTLYASLLADIFTTRWAIWYKKFTEGNHWGIVQWFTKSAGTTFVDCAVKTLGVLGLVAFFDYFGAFTNKFSFVFFLLSIPSFKQAYKTYIAVKSVK